MAASYWTDKSQTIISIENMEPISSSLTEHLIGVFVFYSLRRSLKISIQRVATHSLWLQFNPPSQSPWYRHLFQMHLCVTFWTQQAQLELHVSSVCQILGGVSVCGHSTSSRVKNGGDPGGTSADISSDGFVIELLTVWNERVFTLRRARLIHGLHRDKDETNSPTHRMTFCSA